MKGDVVESNNQRISDILNKLVSGPRTIAYKTRVAGATHTCASVVEDQEQHVSCRRIRMQFEKTDNKEQERMNLSHGEYVVMEDSVMNADGQTATLAAGWHSPPNLRLVILPVLHPSS